jgi:hypothetical protein
MGPWHIYVGYTSSEAAYYRTMKRMKIDDPNKFTIANGGTTHTFTNPKGNLCSLICIDLSSEDNSQAAIAGIVAHEATHVAQELWKWIGEKEPGWEAEAYLIQYIVIEIMAAIDMEKDIPI